MADPTLDIPELLEQSLGEHKSGNLDAARAGYLQILRRAPNNPAALNLLGTLDAQLGNLTDAERLIRKAISFAPGEGGFFTNLAGVLQQQERFEEAIQAYQVALKLEPRQPEVLNNFGALLLSAGKPTDAEQCFRKVLASRPQAPEAHNNLGRALNNQRKFAEALQAFQDAVRLDPAFAAAHNNMGHVYRALGQNTHAAASFQEAIRLDENLVEAYQNLGTVYLAQNMPEEAVECLREAVRRDPQRAGAHTDLGVALHGLGRLDEALDAYREAVAYDGNNPFIYLNLGLVLYERRNLKAAQTAFSQALSLKPDLIDAAAQLAGVFDELGRLEDMQKVIDKGLRIEPGHPGLGLEAARLERRQGKFGEAIQRLSEFDLKEVEPRLAQELRYELSRLHDRIGEPGLAWLHASEANRLAASGWRAHNLDPERLPQRLQKLQAFCSDTDFSKLPVAPADNTAAPVFLVGFPASGSDFVAEVLRAHPQLQVLDEAPTLSSVEQTLSRLPPGYPAAIAGLGEEDVGTQRDAYWRIVNGLLKRTPASIFVDHHPMRAVHAALIWRLFPSARIIYVQRHPGDLCVANFMQNYAMNDTNLHFLSMQTTVSAYVDAHRTWQLATGKLPLNVHSLRFEALAHDAAGELARTLEFLGLENDPAVDSFVREAHRGERITRASFRQLANPLDQHMIDRWKDYRRELSQFMGQLMPLAVETGYDFD